jgi:hypothetical protein
VLLQQLPLTPDAAQQAIIQRQEWARTADEGYSGMIPVNLKRTNHYINAAQQHVIQRQE